MKVYITSVLLLSTLVFATAQTSPSRADLEQIIGDLCQADEHEHALLPPQTQLANFDASNETLLLQLDIPNHFFTEHFDELLHEELIEQFSAQLAPFGFANLKLEAKTSQNTFAPLSQFLHQYSELIAAEETNEDPLPYSRGQQQNKSTLRQQSQASGALSGKTIWLSAGHGWLYNNRLHDFHTQRGNNYGLVEDFATIEIVNYHLLRYLQQAGANVWTVRERDMNENEVIVDNSDGRRAYQETGEWQTSSSQGYKGGSYRYAISNSRTSATATYKPVIPEAGMYWVSVRYRSGLNRCVDTRYRIFHAGGESTVSINQEVHGNTWVYLGQYYFDQGASGRVVLINESNEEGQAIIADAVRFGGGIGEEEDCSFQQHSREPRFEEAARYYANYQGFPHCVNDVMTRPLYAEWELSKGSREERNNAIYLSIHTNANNGQGTETFIHNYRPVKGSWSLREYVHRAVIEDIREQWDPRWMNRGRKSADFGELRGLHKMPGILLEVAFHDHPSDAKALKSPQFRKLVARAVYKGVVRYFANRDGKKAVFLPEPPTHLHGRALSQGKISLAWEPARTGQRPEGYKLYMGTHGKAFGGGIFCRKNRFTLDGLEPGQTYFFRVSAINRGGESMQSSVVAVRLPEEGVAKSQYLIVDGFDRLDRAMAVTVNERQPRRRPLGQTQRLFIEKMNNYDYMVEHARALEANGLSFDGATNEAVADRHLKLDRYEGVDWMLGKESVAAQTLNSKERALLKAYLDKGGNLIISGSELAYDLDYNKSARQFYNHYLKARYIGDNARAGLIQSGHQSLLGKMRIPLKNGAYGQYALTSPDYIEPTQGGQTAIKYANGKTAVVAYKGDFGLLNFAFPLECIGNEEQRIMLLGQALTFLETPGSHKENITPIPANFGEELTVDLGRSPEGKAVFRILDRRRRTVFEQSWAHNGRRSRTFHLTELPAARYEYELEFHNQLQRGFITKTD